MRVLLTSAGLETEEIKNHFISMLGKDTSSVKALFIPTAAIDAEAVKVLPKCMNDLIKCGIQNKNIKVYDLHIGMDMEELGQYDVVYLCGGSTKYLLERINETGFRAALLKYIGTNGLVIGVSAGSIIFANNLPDNLALIDTKLDVHCAEGEKKGKVSFPFKDKMRLTDTCALSIRNFPDELEIIGQ